MNMVPTKLMICCFIIIHYMCFSFPSASAVSTRNNETDRLALLEFKSKITDDPFRVLTSWNSSFHFCQWYGITCGRRGRVTLLNLHSLKLSGSVSPHIGNLSFLKELHLPNNTFGLEIPSQIGHLPRLQLLYLDYNLFKGRIPPTLSNCSNLLSIDLSFNKLAGEIPEELGALMNLKVIDIGNNSLSGSLPLSFGNLSSLEKLNAHYANLQGVIPDSISRLTNLRILRLDSNGFSGPFPAVSNLTSIQVIELSQNYMEGNLPEGLGTSLPNLYFFSIADNRFSGKIPASVFNVSSLQVLQLAVNYLTRKVPTLQKLPNLLVFVIQVNNLGREEDDDLEFLSTFNATSLQVLNIGYNNFGGKLPGNFFNFSRTLESIFIENNQIVGNIESGIGALVDLGTFGASWNKLSGSLPSSLGKLRNLGNLFLNNNHFTGNIPSSFGNLTNLIKFDISDNNLQATVPPSLGNCKGLLLLDLSGNNLSGSIPSQILGISSLSIGLDLSRNRLSGSLSIEVRNLKSLSYLGLEMNLLSSVIPVSLGSCTSLEFLYLGANLFRGSIPSSFKSLKGIQELNLSHNNFSGQIPEFLEGFELKLLDLAYNDFEGKVPTDGVFQNTSATIIAGNKNLCGGIPDLRLPSCKFEHLDRRLSRKLKITILIVFLIMGITLFFVSLFVFRSRKKKRESASMWDGYSLLKVSYQSLLKATDGFSSENLIGRGSFGTVYKGILDQEGTTIAVKVLNLMHRGASRSFTAECEALKNVRHRNLVKVLTACSGADYGGKDFKALVYEFMVNGSLEDWLHPTFEVEGPKRLTFLQRLDIAIDVASALEYLHQSCETPIAHCDLKPSNILLDEEMTARVSDFGLAKFLPKAGSTHESSSSGVRGTIGYCPPEYGIGSDVSTIGDVFSYGIILLEMFSGKRPTDEMFNYGTSLRNSVTRALPVGVLEVVDRSLLQADESVNFRNSKAKEWLIAIFEIGILCSSESIQERMSIGDVVAQLVSIRHKLQNAQHRNMQS